MKVNASKGEQSHMLQRVVKVWGGGGGASITFHGNKTDLLPLTKITDITKLKVHFSFHEGIILQNHA